MPTPSQAAIDAFVKKVIGWSQLLQGVADAALERAHDDFQAGRIGFIDYNAVLQQKIAITNSCLELTNSASKALLSIAESELGPILRATDELEAASTHLDELAEGILVSSEVVIAAAALAVAIATPGTATIAAAGSAVFKLAQQIAKDVAHKP